MGLNKNPNKKRPGPTPPARPLRPHLWRLHRRGLCGHLRGRPKVDPAKPSVRRSAAVVCRSSRLSRLLALKINRNRLHHFGSHPERTGFRDRKTVPKRPPSQLLACVRARDDAQVRMRLGASGYTRNGFISEPALRKGVTII